MGGLMRNISVSDTGKDENDGLTSKHRSALGRDIKRSSRGKDNLAPPIFTAENIFAV